MATKIRLQRHGRKSYAFYSIVIADVRAPRDGKFIEKIGTYMVNVHLNRLEKNLMLLIWLLILLIRSVWYRYTAQPVSVESFRYLHAGDTAHLFAGLFML